MWNTYVHSLSRVLEVTSSLFILFKDTHRRTSNRLPQKAGTQCQERRWKNPLRDRISILVGAHQVSLPLGEGMVLGVVDNRRRVMNYFWLRVIDMDYRGPKNSSKPIKAPSALPPRLQHPSGARQHASSGHSAAPQSQKTSSEHKNLSRTPSQIIR